jgi:hypothetical protein
MIQFSQTHSFDQSVFTGGRKLAVYGGGLLLHQLRGLFPSLKPDVIIDDELGALGVTADGVPIVSSGTLPTLNPREHFVLIGAYANSAVRAIRAKLLPLGFRFPSDVTDASGLLWETMAPGLGELGVVPDEHLFRAVHALFSELPLRNVTSAAGTCLAAHLVRDSLRTGEGDIFEFGTYQGGNAFIVATLLHSALANRQYHMLDSFEGLKISGTVDPQSRAGEFADTDYEAARARFALLSHIRIWKGFFSETLPGLRDRKRVAMSYIDCDLYEPALECLAFTRERLNPGGFILLHDYVAAEWSYPDYIRLPFRGIAKAVAEFTAETGWRKVVFPGTTHVVLQAPR